MKFRVRSSELGEGKETAFTTSSFSFSELSTPNAQLSGQSRAGRLVRDMFIAALILFFYSQLSTLNYALAAASAAPFEGGEVFTYGFRWLGMEVGMMTLETEDQGDCWLFTMTSATRGAGAKIYPIEETLVSLVRKSDFQTLYFRKTENGKKGLKSEETLFAPEEGVFFYREFRDMTERCVDILSFMHYLRTPEHGRSPPPGAYDRGRFYRLSFEPPVKDSVRISGRDIPALKVVPHLKDDREREKKGRMTLWYSDDSRRIPLAVDFSIPVGTLQARLRCDPLPPAVGKPMPPSP